MKKISITGVVGAGTMGAALAQKFAQEGFEVYLADRAEEFVAKGISNIRSMLQQGVEAKVFTQEQIDATLSRIHGTSNLEDLKKCDLIVEAIFENFDAKKELFSSLSRIVKNDTILATNTSSFSVTELSSFVSNPERFVGLHFFYHAAKNRLVEIIPGEKTSAETVEAMRRFSILAGKDPIFCADAYGFVVNRFFVPWLNESVRLFEEGIATKEEIDKTCMEVFGIGMGPFALMNATGVPVAYHAEKTLEFFGPLYHVADKLKEQALAGKPWDLGEIEKVNVAPEKYNPVRDRMLGVVFFVCSQILEEKICSAADINRGAKIGLRWKKGPVDLMKEKGRLLTLELVSLTGQRYAQKAPSIDESKWKIDYVDLSVNGKTAVITFNNPESLNALSEETVSQLNDRFINAESQPGVETIYITGMGKGFVAGADIKFFTRNMKAGDLKKIKTFTEAGQSCFERIDRSKKKVVALLNGLTLGGGLELALCADEIYSVPKAVMGFPETGIGIYPGLGGTQRSAKRIGKPLARYLIHTGKLLTAKDAGEINLIDGILSQEEIFSLTSGETSIIPQGKKELSEKWRSIAGVFESPLSEIMHPEHNHQPNPEELEKIRKMISSKAPIALRIADQLILEGKGPQSELEHLEEIFATEDAWNGLRMMGRGVRYEGK